jgi:hypothetical protein
VRWQCCARRGAHRHDGRAAGATATATATTSAAASRAAAGCSAAGCSAAGCGRRLLLLLLLPERALELLEVLRQHASVGAVACAKGCVCAARAQQQRRERRR